MESAKFLSTLSLRRATTRPAFLFYVAVISIHALLAESDTCWRTARLLRNYFYPRSPCGERRALAAASSSSSIISIHALLAESDGTASPGPPDRTISIHALLAESDDHCTHLFNCFTNFYPRSPCGERHVSTKGSYHTMANFYPRSPCGERHFSVFRGSFPKLFLSTLSLRRATGPGL